MIVRELIEILKTYDPESEVVIETILENFTLKHATPDILASLSNEVVIFPKEN